MYHILKHKKLVLKELLIYSMSELEDRDIIACYKYYLSLIPSEGPFYPNICHQFNLALLNRLLEGIL